MQAEGDDKADRSEECKNIKGAQRPPLLLPEKSALQTPHIMVNAPETSIHSEQNNKSSAIGSLAVVPCKKRGGFDLLRKLLFRRKKGHVKRTKFLALAWQRMEIKPGKIMVLKRSTSSEASAIGHIMFESSACWIFYVTCFLCFICWQWLLWLEMIEVQIWDPESERFVIVNIAGVNKHIALLVFEISGEFYLHNLVTSYNWIAKKNTIMQVIWLVKYCTP